jgi:hypothetical protein
MRGLASGGDNGLDQHWHRTIIRHYQFLALGIQARSDEAKVYGTSD